MGISRTHVLIALTAILALGWYLYGTSSERPKPSPQRQKEQIQQDITNFQLVETTGSNQTWYLRSPKARRESGAIHLQDPRASLQEQGDTTVTIRSDTGVYRLKEQMLHLEGNVVIRRLKENQIFRTEVLNWDRKAGTITTDRPVTLEGPMGVLKATGFRANLATERVEFQSNVEYQSR